MTTLTVEAIKDAINQLPEAEKNVLASWLTVQTMDTWDLQMQADFSAGGRGSVFLEQAKREAAGVTIPLSVGLDQRKR